MQTNNYLYRESLGLFTDLYELTMAYGYWKNHMLDQEAVFHLTFRKWPFRGGYAVAAGLGSFIEFLEHFSFSASDIEYLKTQNFDGEFLDYLKDLKFTCDIDAVEEGTLIFPYEPIIRVKGPILQAQILESAILNIINFQTLIATKASRVVYAAGNDPVVEFGMRRAQGIDGAISASRASFIGGCTSTSHVLAGKLYNIPVKGTMAHSWVMAFDSEEKAFQNFAETLPENCVFLIDTYDSVEGTKKAIKVVQEQGVKMLGVRLDSGDLTYLSKKVRKVLDDEGLKDVKIMASNELDEHLIQDMKNQGTKITIWGVGTNLVTAKDQPALDGVYKLSSVQDQNHEWVDKIKISEQTAKVTIPGQLQIRRFYEEGMMVGDALFDEREDDIEDVLGIPDESHRLSKDHREYKDLLIPIYRRGQLVYDSPSLQDMQKKTRENLKQLDDRSKRFINPQPYFVGLEKKLHEKRRKLIQEMRKK